MGKLSTSTNYFVQLCRNHRYGVFPFRGANDSNYFDGFVLTIQESQVILLYIVLEMFFCKNVCIQNIK